MIYVWYYLGIWLPYGPIKHTHTRISTYSHARTHTHTLPVYLVVHAVDPVWPQQLDGLSNQIGASAVEHAEAQVQVELVRRSFGVQTPERTEAALRPAREREEREERERRERSRRGKEKKGRMDLFYIYIYLR